jgi:hypothetical protein
VKVCLGTGRVNWPACRTNVTIRIKQNQRDDFSKDFFMPMLSFHPCENGGLQTSRTHNVFPEMKSPTTARLKKLPTEAGLKF